MLAAAAKPGDVLKLTITLQILPPFCAACAFGCPDHLCVDQSHWGQGYFLHPPVEPRSPETSGYRVLWIPVNTTCGWCYLHDNSEKCLDSKESLGAGEYSCLRRKKVSFSNGDDLVNVRDLAMLFGQLGLNLYAFMLISIGMGLLTCGDLAILSAHRHRPVAAGK